MAILQIIKRKGKDINKGVKKIIIIPALLTIMVVMTGFVRAVRTRTGTNLSEKGGLRS